MNVPSDRVEDDAAFGFARGNSASDLSSSSMSDFCEEDFLSAHESVASSLPSLDSEARLGSVVCTDKPTTSVHDEAQCLEHPCSAQQAPREVLFEIKRDEVTSPDFRSDVEPPKSDVHKDILLRTLLITKQSYDETDFFCDSGPQFRLEKALTDGDRIEKVNNVFDEGIHIHSKGKYEDALQCFKKSLFKSDRDSGFRLDCNEKRTAANADRPRNEDNNQTKGASLDDIISRTLEMLDDTLLIKKSSKSGCSATGLTFPTRSSAARDDNEGAESCCDGEERERAMELYLEALRFNECSELKLAATLRNMGNYFSRQGNIDEALICLEESRRLHNLHPDRKSLDFADMLDKMSIMYNMKGKLDSAIELEQEALLIYRSELGDRNAKVATSYHNLGCFLTLKGKYLQSKEAFEKALELRKTTFGDRHYDVASTLYNLSSSHNCLGNYNASLSCLNEARSLLHRTDARVADILNRMGDVYRNMGKHSEAMKSYEKVLRSRNNKSACSKLAVAAALHSLGGLENDLGNHSKALVHLRESLQLRRECLGDNHADVATCLCTMGAVYSDQGAERWALRCLNQALKIREIVLGSNHELVGDTHNNIAYYLCSRGMCEKAQHHLSEALRVRRQNKNHAKVADTLSNLGEVYKHIGDGFMAITCYKEELHIRRTLLPEQDPEEIGGIYINMGDSFMLQEDSNNAVKCYDEAFRLWRLHFGLNHLKVADIHSRMVVLNLKRGENEIALQLLQEIFRIRKLQLGERHKSVTDVICNMGYVYVSMCDWLNAHKKFKQALSNFVEADATFEATSVMNMISYVRKMRYNEVCRKMRSTKGHNLIAAVE